MSLLKIILLSLIIFLINGNKDKDYGPQDLFDYVAQQDNSYVYTDTGHTFIGANTHGLYKAYILNMTSGQYLNETIVSRYIWWHYVVLIIPNNISTTDHLFFWTASADPGSCDHPNDLPNAESLDILIASYISTHSGLPSAVIFTNPSQPIIYANDPQQKKRSNDALLAYSFNQSMFFDYPPLFFPMVRANIKALDALQDYTHKKFGWNIKSFAAAGASKWGWTTWLFSAVEDRISQFVVDVFDLLNWNKNAHHMFKSYNGWSWALQDYWENGLTLYLDTQMENNLMAQIDPYMFLQYYNNKPKLLITDGRDEFFMPDDTWIWWNDLPEPKRYLFIGDTDHVGITGLLESLPAISTWVFSNFMNYKQPYIDWKLDFDNYKITTYLKEIPKSAKVWYSESCKNCNGRRDWRAINLDKPCNGIEIDNGNKCYNVHSMWYPINISYIGMENGSYVYEYSMKAPKEGYIAFSMDFRFNMSDFGGLGWPIDDYGEYEFSTQAMVVGGGFPFDDCSGEECYGTLV